MASTDFSNSFNEKAKFKWVFVTVKPCHMRISSQTVSTYEARLVKTCHLIPQAEASIGLELPTMQKCDPMLLERGLC